MSREDGRQLRFRPLARLSLGLAICGSPACVKPGPKVLLGTTSADTISLAPKSCPDDEPRNASTDALGRLVTAPGLCIVEGSKTGFTYGHDVWLELSYDELGRPLQAIAKFDATCDFEGTLGYGVMPPDAEFDVPSCQGSEHHVQRWTWDEHGRLVGVERTVNVQLHEDDPHVDKNRCMMDDTPFTVDAMSWRYDEHGRVETSTSNFHDCDETQQVDEQLGYTDNMVEARAVTTTNGEPSSESSRYHLDDCGRVVHQEIVGPKPRSRWVIEESMDHRTIYLAEDRLDGVQYEVGLDEHQRVISVKSDDEAWALHYDDCPNAALATNRWRLHEILWTWDFPTAPLPGKGKVALDRWLHAELPLLPELLD